MANLSRRLVSEVLGLLNCGELVKLKVSARSSMLALSPNLKVLKSARFRAKRLGPLNIFRPLVPNRTPVGWAKLEVLNQGLPTLMPCRIWTGATWSAVWDSPGVFKLLPLAPTVPIGVPVMSVRTPESCQLPSAYAAGPWLSQRLPKPHGNS